MKGGLWRCNHRVPRCTFKPAIGQSPTPDKRRALSYVQPNKNEME
ncbi:Unknown protein sequence [Pseudomonas amygdali pv. sesami]|nr:Unknown protein sequence [Pseudomonas amygdali pv. sesami]